MRRAIVIVVFLTLVVSELAAATIDRGTLIVLDTSGSGAGEGVATPTDDSGLRLHATRTLLDGQWIGADGKSPSVAVVTCGEKPKILLTPTADDRVISKFAKDLAVTSAGATSMDATLSLLSKLDGRPDDIIYIGDGLLTKPGTPSARIVAELPAALKKMYGAAPRLHMIAVDSSGRVLAKTRRQWVTITDDRIATVASTADVRIAVETTVRNLNWRRPPIRRHSAAPSTPAKNPSNVIALSVAILLSIVFIGLRSKRSRLSAFITVEENGRTHRTSARNFGKSEVSIGGHGCDVSVPDWEKPITVVERDVVGRHGRKQRQTIARQGNRSVIVGTLPATFSNGKTTVKIRGGRR